LSLTIATISPNYNQLSFELLSELVTIQLAIANGSSVDKFPGANTSISTSSDYSTRTIVMNALIITSLVLSLAAALIAVVVNQWLNYYSSNVPGTLRAVIHHFRLRGLQNWGVAEIIGVVPYLLHFALLFFLVGLVLFLQELDQRLFILAIALTALFYGAYFLSHILSVWYTSCPYKTQGTELIHWISRSLYMLLSQLRKLRKFEFSRVLPPGFRHQSKHSNPRLTEQGKETELEEPKSPFDPGNSIDPVSNIRWALSCKDVERMSVNLEEQRVAIMTKMLLWLLSHGSNPSVAPIVAYALAGLPRLPFSMKL